MNEYLNEFELYQLTGAIKASSQVSWLKQNGVPFRLDGKRLIVSRVHARQWIEGAIVPTSKGLNLAGIR